MRVVRPTPSDLARPRGRRPVVDVAAQRVRRRSERRPRRGRRRRRAPRHGSRAPKRGVERRAGARAATSVVPVPAASATNRAPSAGRPARQRRRVEVVGRQAGRSAHSADEPQVRQRRRCLGRGLHAGCALRSPAPPSGSHVAPEVARAVGRGRASSVTTSTAPTRGRTRQARRRCRGRTPPPGRAASSSGRPASRDLRDGGRLDRHQHGVRRCASHRDRSCQAGSRGRGVPSRTSCAAARVACTDAVAAGRHRTRRRGDEGAQAAPEAGLGVQPSRVAIVKPPLLALTKREWNDGEKIPAHGRLRGGGQPHLARSTRCTLAHFVYDHGRIVALPRQGRSCSRCRSLGRIADDRRPDPGRPAEPRRRRCRSTRRSRRCATASASSSTPRARITRDPDLWPMRGKTGAARIALEHRLSR